MSEDLDNVQSSEETDLAGESGSQALEEALRSSFTILKVVILIVIVYLIFSNTFSVDEDTEGAIILRFGRAKATDSEAVFKPGIRFAWPEPIDKKVEIKRARPVLSDAAWYAPIGRVEIGQDLTTRSIDASRDGYAITRDKKIVHIKAEITYGIEDPSKFRFGFADAGKVLQLALDNAVIYVAKQQSLSTILKNSSQFTDSVKARLSKLADAYGLGIDPDDTRIKIGVGDVQLPFMAIVSYEGFKAVPVKVTTILNTARSEAAAVRRAIESNNDQNGTSLSVLSGEVASIRNQANNQAQALRASVDSLAARFKDIIEKYPDPVTRRRYMEQLYYESMERIADNDDVKIYLLSKGSALNPAKLRLMINEPPPDVEEE